MKRIKIILTLALTAFLFNLTQAEAAQKRYEIKSGHIQYKISGQSNGTEDLYWSNFGEKEARYAKTTINIFGMNQSTNTISYMDGDWSYSYDPKSNVASKMNYKEFMGDMADKNPQDFRDEMLATYGGEKIGTEKILGKKCDVYKLTKMNDYKVWIYKGLPLKSEANMMGFSFQTEAVEFKENAKIDEAKLTVPKEAIIRDVDLTAMKNAQGKQMDFEALNEMKNSPEFQEAMEKMQAMQNDPKMQKAIQEAQAAQMNNQSQANREAVQAMKEEAANNAAEEGAKKAISGALKSFFK